MALDVPLLRSSFQHAIEQQPQLTTRFYEILFERFPTVRPLFRQNPTAAQALMLQRALVAVMDKLEDAAWLSATLRAMGAKHVGYGVSDEMYEWVGASLLATLGEAAGDHWSPQLERAWAEAYGAIAALMRDGARESGQARG